jgi:hypothetical protein
MRYNISYITLRTNSFCLVNDVAFSESIGVIRETRMVQYILIMPQYLEMRDLGCLKGFYRFRRRFKMLL